MLEKFRVDTQIVVTDVARAKDFYENKLGLVSEDFPLEGIVFYPCAEGTGFYLYHREAGPQGDNTVMSFKVDNIEETVTALKQKGVVFEEYDTESFKTVKGIAAMGPAKAAWFKDPDGNFLALFQM